MKSRLVSVIGILLPALLVLASCHLDASADPSAYNCKDFAEQAQAQELWQPGDPYRLDRNGDGRACDSLPCPCSYDLDQSRLRRVSQAPVATVAWVADGDTLTLRRKGSAFSVRILGIDTPERGQCGAKKATQNLKRLAPTGARVRLVTDPTQDNKDRYQRRLRHVYVRPKHPDQANKKWVDIGLRQVASGWARVYQWQPPFTRVERYIQVQEHARGRNLGIWRCAPRVPPWQLSS